MYTYIHTCIHTYIHTYIHTSKYVVFSTSFPHLLVKKTFIIGKYTMAITNNHLVECPLPPLVCVH